MRSFLTILLISCFLGTADARRKKAGSKSSSDIAQTQEEIFTPVEEALKRNKPDKALSLINEILSDETKSEYFIKAKKIEIKAFQKLRLPYSSFIKIDALIKESLSQEEESDYVQQLIDLSEELGEEAQLATLLSAQQQRSLEQKTQDLIIYNQAKEALRRKEFATALSHTEKIAPKSKYYAQTLNIKAVTLSQQGRFDEALLPFNRGLAKLKDQNKYPKLQEIMRLNLARNYYAAGIYSAAIEGFDSIPRESPYWVEAQFEKAWSLFRQEEINAMLSILQTHASDFFVDGVYPEEEMLRIYGFFLLCKFETTEQAVDVFENRYQSHLIELKTWASKSEKELFTGFINHKEGGLPLMLSRHFTFEDQMNEAVYTVQALDKEIEALQNIGNFTAPLVQRLEERRRSIMLRHGGRIKAKAQWKATLIEGILQNLKITRLDIGELKQRILTQAARTGKIPTAKRQAKRKIKAKRNHNLWTYQGEQWADELGYFQIKVTSECPASF